jgi:hypothetical protein
VRELVAKMGVPWQHLGFPAARKVDQLLIERREAAKLLSALLSQRDTALKEQADLIVMTGCRDLADVEDMANVGKSLMDAIDLNTRDGPIKGWSPADDPAEIVVDLLNLLSDAEARSETLLKVIQKVWRTSIRHDHEITRLVDIQDIVGTALSSLQPQGVKASEGEGS